VLVADEQGRIIYFNQAVTRLIGLQPAAEDLHVTIFAGSGWKTIAARIILAGRTLRATSSRSTIPGLRFLRLYAAPLTARRRAAPAWR